MSEFQICPDNLCTGCSACMNACPKDAITMEENPLGYMHPLINAEKCVDCGMCERVCPALHALPLHKPQNTYAAISNNKNERLTSSSGGAASVIGRWIVEQGGVVYGCSQENYQVIRHIRVDNINDIVLLKGSKYVQSDINLVFREVRKDLRDNKRVLFVGTPCQVAGLKNFLRKDYEGLLTADLICHGVPSQRMLREDIEQNCAFQPEFAKRTFVNFRWKAQYGIQFGVQFGVQGKNEEKKKLLDSNTLPYDPYILAFFTGMSFRENCHTCPYSKSERIGDITIGDFWKLGSFAPTQFKIKDGVSLILVNTDKGKEVMNQIKDRFVLEERDLKEAVLGNDNLRRPSPRPRTKDLFIKVYKESGLKSACKASVPTKLYYKLVAIETIKRQRFFINTFKKIRLLKNKILS